MNARSYRLEYFQGSDIPQYAILSHKWGSEEVSHRDVLKRKGERKEGWRKIKLCCLQALRDSLDYVWVDTCCIDKSSSAELSESINSMYNWYSNAEVCYVYLQDVESTHNGEIQRSDWFNRGWTLQELLAPQKVEFYNNRWKHLGSRQALASLVYDITGIPFGVLALEDRMDMELFSVADRMSWAAKRRTTREEDRAYSLLGIFQVNMPLLYGEGSRAFRRLQEEILKTTEDPTIFAWGVSSPRREHLLHKNSLFAASPDWFDHQRIHKSWLESRYKRSEKQEWKKGSYYTPELHHEIKSPDVLAGVSISRAGLSLSMWVVPYLPNIYFVPLAESHRENSTSRVAVGMMISRDPETGSYHRLCSMSRESSYDYDCFLFDIEYWLVNQSGNFRKLMLEHSSDEGILAGVDSDALTGAFSLRYGFEMYKIETDQDTTVRLYSHFIHSLGRQYFLLKPGTWGIAGVVEVHRSHKPTVLLLFGFTFDFDLFCLAVQNNHGTTFKSSEEPVANWLVHLRRMDGVLRSVWNNMQVMAMVGFLQSDVKYKTYQLHEDGVELLLLPTTHQKSSTVRGQRLIANIGVLSYEGYVYDLIKFHLDLTQHSVRQKTKYATEGPYTSRDEMLWAWHPQELPDREKWFTEGRF